MQNLRDTQGTVHAFLKRLMFWCGRSIHNAVVLEKAFTAEDALSEFKHLEELSTAVAALEVTVKQTTALHTSRLSIS